jgi:hypothetical protein
MAEGDYLATGRPQATLVHNIVGLRRMHSHSAPDRRHCRRPTVVDRWGGTRIDGNPRLKKLLDDDAFSRTIRGRRWGDECPWRAAPALRQST